jgi:hypothetical protein
LSDGDRLSSVRSGRSAQITALGVFSEMDTDTVWNPSLLIVTLLTVGDVEERIFAISAFGNKKAFDLENIPRYAPSIAFATVALMPGMRSGPTPYTLISVMAIPGRYDSLEKTKTQDEIANTAEKQPRMSRLRRLMEKELDWRE